MRKPLRPARNSLSDAKEEAEAMADADLRAHYLAFCAVCAFSDAVLARHPERQRFLDAQDPLPAASQRHIEELKRRARVSR